MLYSGSHPRIWNCSNKLFFNEKKFWASLSLPKSSDCKYLRISHKRFEFDLDLSKSVTSFSMSISSSSASISEFLSWSNFAFNDGIFFCKKTTRLYSLFISESFIYKCRKKKKDFSIEYLGKILSKKSWNSVTD